MKIASICSLKRNFTNYSMNTNQKTTKVNFNGESQQFRELLAEAERYGVKLLGNESLGDLTKLVNEAKLHSPKRSLFKRIFVDLEFASDNTEPPAGWGTPGGP